MIIPTFPWGSWKSATSCSAWTDFLFPTSSWCLSAQAPLLVYFTQHMALQGDGASAPVRTSVHSWLKASLGSVCLWVTWWTFGFCWTSVPMFWCEHVSFICLFIKKNLRAEWQGHKRTSCLMFQGTGKLFFQLVSPFCVSSNTVRGLQYTSVPPLPALICLLRLAVLACETVPWLWSSHPRWWWAVSISPGACQPFVYRF